jgi:hypothetical protein
MFAPLQVIRASLVLRAGSATTDFVAYFVMQSGT